MFPSWLSKGNQCYCWKYVYVFQTKQWCPSNWEVQGRLVEPCVHMFAFKRVVFSVFFLDGHVIDPNSIMSAGVPKCQWTQWTQHAMWSSGPQPACFPCPTSHPKKRHVLVGRFLGVPPFAFQKSSPHLRPTLGLRGFRPRATGSDRTRVARALGRVWRLCSWVEWHLQVVRAL